MNRLLTILLLAAGTAYGQINNPPTSVNIVDSTATGRAVLTATNAAAAATAIGLGITNNVTFNRVQVGGSSFTADNFSGGDFEITAGHALTFASGGAPGATLTNLGLGAANNVEFRRLKMIAADATDNGDDATLWLDTSGTNKYATMRLSGTGGSAEKYNAYLQGGSSGLQVSAANGFRVLSGPTAGVGSVLFAVNSSGNATLNGTANLAPSQTASSGASLMTRDLVDQAYMATPNALQLGAIAGATNGTGAGVIIGFNMAGDARLRPGGSTNGYASAYFVKNISGGAAAIASSRINFAQSIDVSGQLRMTTASNVDTKVRFIVGANSSSAVPASADALAFSNAGFGFEIDSLTNSLIKRVRLIYHDGSTNRQSEYHNFATNDFLNNVIMSYRIVSQAGNIQLYFLASATLEGALPLVSGPVISVTNGPATTNSSDHSAILVSAAQDSVTYTNHAIAVFSPIKLRQN